MAEKLIKQVKVDELVSYKGVSVQEELEKVNEAINEELAKESAEKEAIEEIANEAIRQKTGARGLRTIVEKMLMDIMFQIPDIKGKKQFTVTKKIVQGKEKNLSEKILQLPDAS